MLIKRFVYFISWGGEPGDGRCALCVWCSCRPRLWCNLRCYRCTLSGETRPDVSFDKLTVSTTAPLERRRLLKAGFPSTKLKGVGHANAPFGGNKFNPGLRGYINEQAVWQLCSVRVCNHENFDCRCACGHHIERLYFNWKNSNRRCAFRCRDRRHS